MSLNKVILIGRLGRDPEIRYMTNGESVCNLSLATSEHWTDRSGNRVERTEWHNVTFYRRLAEVAAQYLRKGGQVYIEGRIQSRKYQGKDGIERTAYDIIGSELKMLGRSRNAEQPAPQPPSSSAQSYPAPPTAPKMTAEQYRAASGGTQRQASAAPVTGIDDDIPY